MNEMQKYFEINNLKKIYNHNCVLEIPELILEKGKIYGIVGANGAGKTTLFRIIAKLTYPTEGAISYYQDSKLTCGIMIEGPYLDCNLTAEENLKWIQIIHNEENNEKIVEILDLVGLGEVKKKKVKDFSLGMKQRLGLATTLVHDPDILLLDEPMNGLDPNGIIEVREIIKKLNKSGVTIIIASHILDELDKVATDFIFLKKGRIVEKINSHDLERKCQNQLEISSDNMKKMKEILEEELQLKVIANGDMCILENCNLDVLTISRAVTERNIIIKHLFSRRKSLEEYYLKLMED